MEGAKEKAILALDYDDDDSSDEEEDEEIFDNSKVDWRVKGILLRGKEFSVSDNGNCPRCQSNVIVFVILDELFPMGDMPEILYNLLAKGKAVLWSSQDKHSCKKSPTFMCRGFCPPDPLGAGFNINWDTVNLTKLLKDLLRLNIAKAQKKLQESEKVNENEGEDDDVNEKDIIKAMLAQEQEKQDTEEPVHGPFKENETPKETSPSEAVATTSTTSAESSTTPVTSPATTSSPTTAATYPVSKDGSCPHCGSTSVRYIILIKDSSKDIKLPPTLDKLLKLGKAFKMAKGANSPPSFQCCSCTYGFNLDWSKTNLKKIFNFETETTSSSTSTTTKATASSTAVSSTAYQTSTSYPATSYPTSSYGSYAYTQPPMGYPAPGPYGYPGPAPLMAQSATGMVPPPPMGGGMAPLPYGAPIPYAGAQLYPGMPPQPYGLAPPPGPFMGPPQPYPPPNQFGPTPQGNMLPPTFQPPPGGPPMFAMQPPNFHGRGNIPGTMPGSIPGIMPSVSVSSPNMIPGPRPLPGFLQGPGPIPMPGPGPIPMPGPGPIPMPGPMQGLAPFPGNPQGPGNFPANMQVPGNMQAMPRLRVPKGPQTGRKKKWKGKWKGQQGQHANHENLELQEQWQHVDGESHEDNEGEEGTSEDQYDPDAATRFEELLNKIDENENEGDHEDEKPPGEETQAEFEVTAFSPGEKPADTSETIVKNETEVKNEKTQASPSNVTTKPEPTSLSDLEKAPENNGETNVTSHAENEGLETSPSPRTKASRGRKRAATGARKKTAAARNTRSKKAAEDAAELEDGIGNNNDTDGLTETADDIKKAKVDSEQSQGNADANESIKEETAEDIAPKRVTRARSLRQKK